MLALVKMSDILTKKNPTLRVKTIFIISNNNIKICKNINTLIRKYGKYIFFNNTTSILTF